ncbi:hypothetical protein Hanom_Chr02g00167201 [Helianthus anomalus]
MSLKRKKVAHAVFLLTLWSLWQLRNVKVFNNKSISICKLIEDIKDTSLQYRSSFREVSWSEWI